MHYQNPSENLLQSSSENPILYFASSPETFCEYVFSYLPGNFALKNGGDFWWFFSGLHFPRNEARKLLKRFGGNSERNSGQNSGQKFEKFGELSDCDFPGLTILRTPLRSVCFRTTPCRAHAKGVVLSERRVSAFLLWPSRKPPFWEPLLRTLLGTPPPAKLHKKTPSKNPSCRSFKGQHD